MKSSIPHRSFKATAIGWCVAQVVRILYWTLRVSLEDAAGTLKRRDGAVLIWVVWHNRILALPPAYRRHFGRRRMVVLTSASKDGAVLERVVGIFGIGAVRGSSSRRGGQALAELRSHLEAGVDAVFTPDGPRGPCYKLAAGPVKLAQLCGAAVIPISVRYFKAWRLKSWDRFFIPKPFSKVKITILPAVTIDPLADEEAFEAERLRLETLMQPAEDDR